MKNITKLLIATPFLISSSVYANQPEKNKLVAQVNLGAVYTSVNNYSGTGYKASALINLPMIISGSDFYGKLSYQTSHDEKNGSDFYFEESELTLGIAYNISDKQRVFLEGGDIKQSFDQNEQGVWKDYGYVIRLGTQIQKEGLNFQIALEQRDGVESDLGYNYSFAFFKNKMRISYTDVGDYQSLGLSFQTNF
jgi:hypothetical protein